MKSSSGRAGSGVTRGSAPSSPGRASSASPAGPAGCSTRSAGRTTRTATGPGGEPRVGNRLLSLGQGLPSVSLRAALQLADGAPVWEIRRQRLVNGEPKVYETAVIPVALAAGLDRYTAELSGSLYELLAERYGLEDQAEEQYLEVGAADDDERRLLRLPSKSQVVRLRGLSSDQNGTPFDCFTQVYPALEFGFYISGGTSRGLFRTTSWDGWGVTAAPVRSEEK